MSQRIQFRRGTDASRQTIVPNAGEPIWVTDTNSLYIGDGLTTGGISAGGFPDSENYVMVAVTNSEIGNGVALRNAFQIAKNLTPYSKPRSKYNRVDVLIPGAVYDMAQSGIVIDNSCNYIGFYGIGTRENVVIKGSPRGFPTANHAVQGAIFSVPGPATGVSFENITIIGINTGWGVVPLKLDTTSKEVVVNNVAFFSSGYLGTGSAGFSLTSSLGTFSNVVIYSSSSINSSVFNDCYFSGAVCTASMNDVEFNNCNFFGKLSLFLDSTSANTKFNKCSFVGISGFATPINSAQRNNLLFRECYFSGQNNPTPMVLDDSHSVVGYYKNCTFLDAYIENFEGEMENCYINSTQNGKPTFIKNDSIGATPKFYNCTIINDSTFAATISGSQSMILSHCRLNKIFTGMTQLLGSTGFSIINSNFS